MAGNRSHAMNILPTRILPAAVLSLADAVDVAGYLNQTIDRHPRTSDRVSLAR
jgi:hypothetical protein